MSQDFYYGTGKRKTSVSRTRMYRGTGKITVNGRDLADYFPRATLQMIIQQPLKLTKTIDKVDVVCRVTGGGLSGQAQAVRHGISRALLSFDPELRGVLKRAGFLTRDSRIKERKKYGQRAARARFQYSKR
ncbi:MAG: ribosomal protein [Desulfomicrobiaceae bacterium]|jgi:small subunit ribosomal protein S9|nr:30S ribosomal protein S9 [Desulfomicrobiaceae bacterium]MBZ4684550.1 ribosomal protein [Desulfomicrobiaceae bacterium]MDI3493187.1 small subunit ribosomal protein [Desulfomicrobiaceae bacterium]MDK2872762.1 small subunit ribosomal protein [Desulfomicrobiaceae bacterium]HCF04799.1 30S ribosomal protein S9 [Desulfomicrobiaceae bacterium]